MMALHVAAQVAEPLPPPPVEQSVEFRGGCDAQTPLCIWVPPVIVADTGEDPHPLSDGFMSLRPQVVGGYRAGDLIHGHPVTDDVLWAVWRWFPPEDQPSAVRVAGYESGFDPLAVSPSDDHGLWQHHGRFIPGRLAAVGLPPDADIYDIEVQARMTAWLVEQAGGWSPWATAGVARARL